MKQLSLLIVLLVVPTVLWRGRWVMADATGFCTNTVLSRHPSPGGGHAAIVFARECGATTPLAFGVSIAAPRVHKPHGPGNVLLARWATSESLPDSLARRPGVVVTWVADSVLLVERQHESRFYFSRSSVGAVSVAYSVR